MTKIAKEQFHPDLRGSVGFLGIVTYLLSRKWGLKLFHAGINMQKGQKVKGLKNEERYITSNHGGPDIRVRIYRPENLDQPLPAFLYLHGGGYSVGNPEQAADTYKALIAKRPCVIIAPAYRRSIQEPYPAAFNDAYDTLLWINEHAEELNIIKDKIIVGGHSAGGGLTAAVTLKARDTQDVKIAFQMPIYPMIEDRHHHKSSQFDSPIWSVNTNKLGWKLYLDGLSEIPAYAAPARNKDYTHFPPTITFVGDSEPFRDENIEYVNALKAANIPVKFKLYEGCFHGFDLLLSKAGISQDALNFTYDSYAEYYDKYVTDWIIDDGLD